MKFNLNIAFISYVIEIFLEWFYTHKGVYLLHVNHLSHVCLMINQNKPVRPFNFCTSSKFYLFWQTYPELVQINVCFSDLVSLTENIASVRISLIPRNLISYLISKRFVKNREIQ